jgi:hypothetical protein
MAKRVKLQPGEEYASYLIRILEDAWVAWPDDQRADFVDLLKQSAEGYASYLVDPDPHPPDPRPHREG